MKKLKFFFTILMILDVLFVACNNNPDSNNPENSIVDSYSNYTVKIYKQEKIGSNSYLLETIEKTGITDTNTDYNAPEIDGYEILPYVQKTINEDESTVLEIYYKIKAKYVEFGSYNQSSVSDLEPIKWRILEKYDDGSALLFAEKILDVRAFDNLSESCSYENSDIRTFLNDEFLNKAFTGAEKQRIKIITLENNVGNRTNDKVFLLSLEEISKYYDLNATELVHIATKCAEDKGVSDYWWTRTFDTNNQNKIITIYNSLIIKPNLFYLQGGVVPAMRVMLEN